MAGYRLTPQARTGLRNILEYIDMNFGLRVAERVLDQIVAALRLLTENHGLGRSREDLTADREIRFWTVGPTLIAYRSVKDTIEILIIERGARNWERLLADEF